MTTREHAHNPSPLRLYLKAAAASVPLPARRRRPAEAAELPDLTLVRSGVRVDRGHLADYDRVCGFTLTDTLPSTYPHVLVFGLHLALMTDRAFPLAPMGLVHIENRIRQHRPLRADEALDLSVTATRLRAHPRGRQLDLVSYARVGGEVVWQETSTLLARGAGGGSDDGTPRDGEAQRSDLAELRPPAGSTSWRLPGDLGRRYAAASGDRNPIHLSRLTARPFGFPRQIAHGMWSKARCLAALAGRLPDAYRVEVAFRKPILLPSTVTFGADLTDGRGEFGLVAGSAGGSATAHLVGRVGPLDEAER